MSGAVEVICLGDSAYLQDLGLNLTRGAIATVTLSAANRSKDLPDAKARGIVEVRVMKAQIVRTPSAPLVQSDNHRSISRAAISPTPSSPVYAPGPASDTGPLVRAISDLAKQVSDLRIEVSKLSERTPDLDSVVAAVSLAVSGMKFEGGGGGRIASSSPDLQDHPRFIPTGIVDPSVTADINTQTSQTGGVSEAQNALRALRKKSGENKDG